MPLTRLARPVRLARSPSLNPTVLGDIPGLPANLVATAARHWLTPWSISRPTAARPEGGPGTESVSCSRVTFTQVTRPQDPHP